MHEGEEEIRLALPTEMMKKVSEIVNREELGYEDREEFFRESVRENIFKIEGK